MSTQGENDLFENYFALLSPQAFECVIALGVRDMNSLFHIFDTKLTSIDIPLEIKEEILTKTQILQEALHQSTSKIHEHSYPPDLGGSYSVNVQAHGLNIEHLPENGLPKTQHEITGKDHDIATKTLLNVANKANVKKVIQLIQEGADANATGYDGMTPLMWAAQYNPNSEIIQVLIEKGAHVNTADKDKKTPLMYAAGFNPNSDVLRILLEKGANVNAVSKQGLTPLMFAARYNTNPEVLQILIDNGTDVTIKDTKGKRAFDYTYTNAKLKKTDAYNHLREMTLSNEITEEDHKKATEKLFYTAKNGCARKEKTKGLYDEVLEWLKNKEEPCSWSELEDFFVQEREYNEKTLRFALKKEEVFCYAQGVFAHRDTLGITPDIVCIINAAAKNEFKRSLNAGKLFALISSILLHHQLPKLSNEILWTSTLITQMIDSMQNVRILGSARNAFICLPHPLHIETFEDLVYILLKERESGACLQKDLEKYLKEEGVITKGLTSLIMHNQKKVMIQDGVLYIQDAYRP